MKNLIISDENYEKIKNKLDEEEKIDIDVIEDLIGRKFYIRTITYHCVGKITKKVGSFLVLEDASWIADSGRFSDAIKDGFGISAEIEPVGEMMVNLNSIVDMFIWKHSLPTKQQ